MKQLFLLTFSLFVAFSTNIHASGSSGGGGGGGFGGGGGGSTKRGIDSEKLTLGRQVFSGRGVGSKVISKAAYQTQTTSLKSLISYIAKKHSVEEAKRLPAREIVGKMTQKQMNALKYYVRTHYGRRK